MSFRGPFSGRGAACYTPFVPRRVSSFVEMVARACHEANRAYCIYLEDGSQLPWEQAGRAVWESMYDGVEFAVKEFRRTGIWPEPSESHENWLRHKLAAGWTYAPEKNVEAKQHPCMVPYDELPLAQRAKDHVFISIVKTFAAFEPSVTE